VKVKGRQGPYLLARAVERHRATHHKVLRVIPRSLAVSDGCVRRGRRRSNPIQSQQQQDVDSGQDVYAVRPSAYIRTNVLLGRSARASWSPGASSTDGCTRRRGRGEIRTYRPAVAVSWRGQKTMGCMAMGTGEGTGIKLGGSAGGQAAGRGA
jgi:hypothetical protein